MFEYLYGNFSFAYSFNVDGTVNVVEELTVLCSIRDFKIG